MRDWWVRSPVGSALADHDEGSMTNRSLQQHERPVSGRCGQLPGVEGCRGPWALVQSAGIVEGVGPTTTSPSTARRNCPFNAISAR